MIVGTPGFKGERLVQAREARGMTSTGLADLIGISPTTISQYEHDAQTPRPETLEKLSVVLNLPKAFFLHPVPQKGRTRIFYRSMSSAMKSARTRAERRFEWLKEIADYLRLFFDFPPLNLPEFDLPQDYRKLTNDRIEALAGEARGFWNLGNGPISNLVRLLEHSGIIVVRGNLEAETLDAFSENEPNDQPFIFLGADKNVSVRSRLDGAHELGHVLLHKKVDKKSISLNRDFKLIEEQAFRFASAFLLPEDQFLDELWAPTLDAFRSLKERWKVSIGAMIKRCEDLGIIDESQSKRLWINRNRRKWGKKEPLDNSIQMEEPTLLRHCVELLIDREIKTKTQIIEDLRLSPTDIEALSGLPSGYLAERAEDVSPLPQLKGEGEYRTAKVISFNRKR